MNIIEGIIKLVENTFKTVSSKEKGLEMFNDALNSTKNEFPRVNIEDHVKEIFKK